LGLQRYYNVAGIRKISGKKSQKCGKTLRNPLNERQIYVNKAN
jgi:hypothetical protein